MRVTFFLTAGLIFALALFCGYIEYRMYYLFDATTWQKVVK